MGSLGFVVNVDRTYILSCRKTGRLRVDETAADRRCGVVFIRASTARPAETAILSSRLSIWQTSFPKYYYSWRSQASAHDDRDADPESGRPADRRVNNNATNNNIIL